VISSKTPSAVELTTGDVARIFEVHPSTVRRWCQRGTLKSCRTGPRSSRRFLKWDIAAAYLDMSIQKYLRRY
jgi:excisionase family DNA binding protein